MEQARFTLSLPFQYKEKITIKKIAIWVIFIISLYAYLRFFKNALIDDAFIPLSYARSILHDGTWGFFPGYISNTATSPLNVILLIIVGLVIGTNVNAHILLSTAALCIISFSLFMISKCIFKTKQIGFLASSAFIFNPLLISTLGLEGLWFCAFFIMSIYFYVIQKTEAMGIILALMTLTRPEALLFFLIILIFFVHGKDRIRFLIIYLLFISPWYLFSWIHLGSFIPDTFFIKTAQGPWAGSFFWSGIKIYAKIYPLETALSLAFAPLTLFLFNRHSGPVRVLALITTLALVHYLGYAFLMVPPYHWYYVPEITAIILLGSIAFGNQYARYAGKTRGEKALRCIFVLWLIIPPAGMSFLLAKGGGCINEAPIHTNWATHERYKEVALWLRENTGEKTSLLRGEIGTLAYYSGCYLMDAFSDRRWLTDFVAKKTREPSPLRYLYKLNFFFFSPVAEFPPYAFRVTGHTNRTVPEAGVVAQWETSTKWIPRGLITVADDR